jgi:chromodomain-helicase-DNA-binding protein 1
MSTPVMGATSNGHLSPDVSMGSPVVRNASPSDSNASDRVRRPDNQPSPTPSYEGNNHSNNNLADQHMSESDAPTPDNVSDDGDFAMQDSPPSHHEDDDLHNRASSTDSNPAAKRKAPVEEDEFIKANPALYGLRRSVCFEKFSLTALYVTNATLFRLDQGNREK